VSKLVLSPKAKSDLSNIWDYSLDTWGTEKAEIYLRKLWSDMQRCADNPEIASKANIVRQGYRKMVSGSHVVYLKEIEGGINVIRVLHQRMDFKGKV
jgi:toxin ParE1/3/4